MENIISRRCQEAEGSLLNAKREVYRLTDLCNTQHAEIMNLRAKVKELEGAASGFAVEHK